MFRFIVILIAVSTLPSLAQDYDLYPPPRVITEYRMESISIVTKAEMELGKLPDHPKITWLGYSSIRLPNKYDPYNPAGEMQTDNRIFFIANTPGIIEFPPVPIVLENKEFFIRIGEIEVARNTASTTNTKLEILWNGQPEIPKELHLGEAVEIQFLEYAQNTGISFNERAFFSEPTNNLEGAQWHQYVRYSGRKPIPSDYFFSHTFNRYGNPENYKESALRVAGVNYDVRSYKARLYFTKTGKATGHLSATLGTNRSVSRRRTHVLPFEIDVLPIPPLPNNQAFDTGLVGDWQLEADYRPNQPIASRAFTVDLTITGRGNPDLRNDFDFSAEGFPSVESHLYPRVGSNYDSWEADFTQTLLPTGKVGILPPITLASFDTVADQWRFTEITPSFTLTGFSDVSAALTPRTSPGLATTRPVLLNLPVATFGAFALAPLLPFLFGFIRKRLEARDPEQKARERTFKKLIANFKAGQGTPEAIDNDLLPILRHQMQLPSGSTVPEIAAALDDPDLSLSLKNHAASTFSTTAKPVDYLALASQLAKFTLLILCTFSGLKGATLEEANASFEEANYRKAIEEYQTLIDEDPNRSSLYFNLAQANFLANDPARARAACHTALLLDPLDKEARDLMSEIRERQGDLTVARNRLLDLRPDQWIILAAVIWVFTFLSFGIRKFRTLPRWPGFAAGALALALLATAAWRQTHDYASDQYMILADELPREPKAGTPDWNYPALRAGQIVQVAEVNETHARVKSSESSFWLPIRELQQVW